MQKKISGNCLCGAVNFVLEDNFSQFHLCHCTQCQKMTGSAHASNLFTQCGNIEWVSGEEKIKRYDYPNRDFSNAFCIDCGSHVPYVSKTGKYLIAPAGTLNEKPHLKAQDNIFWCERAPWYDESLKSVKCKTFPEEI